MKAEFIRQDEVNEVAKETTDPVTKQLVNSAIASAVALTPLERKEWPVCDFDMKYFAEVMLTLFAERNHEYLTAILRGEDMRLWGDEDSGDNEVGER